MIKILILPSLNRKPEIVNLQLEGITPPGPRRSRRSCKRFSFTTLRDSLRSNKPSGGRSETRTRRSPFSIYAPPFFSLNSQLLNR